MQSLGTEAFWVVALGLGVGTFLLRFSFIYSLERVEPPEWSRRLLRLVPAAVLAALVALGLTDQGEAVGNWPGSERLLPGLLAAAVAWRTRSMLATIAVGLAALWLLRIATSMLG